MMLPKSQPDPSTGTTSQTRSTHQIPALPIWLLLTSRSGWSGWRERHRSEMYQMTSGKTETEGRQILRQETICGICFCTNGVMEFHQPEAYAKLEVTCDAWIHESSAGRSAYISSRSWPMQCASTRPSYVLTSAATRLATRRSGGWGVVREWMALKNRYEERSDVFFALMELNQTNANPTLEATCDAWTILCTNLYGLHCDIYDVSMCLLHLTQEFTIPTKYQTLWLNTIYVKFIQMFKALPKHRTIDYLI